MNHGLRRLIVAVFIPLTLIVTLVGCSARTSSAGNASTPTSDTVSPQDTATPPAPTAIPQAPATDTPVPAAVRIGVYNVTLQGTAGVTGFSMPAALAVIPGQYHHPIDICLGTGTVLSPQIAQAPGVIYYQSNSKCIVVFGGGNGAGANAAYDDGFVTADLQSGAVTVSPDPTHCCSYNLSPNTFDISASLYTTNHMARGSIQLQFQQDGSVTGDINLAGCQVVPNCSDAEAVFYEASLSGSFSHS
jgi:hypothetical protein